MSTVQPQPTKAKKRPPRGDRLLLHGVSWESYIRVGRAFQDRRLRMTYDRGTLEIMTVSPKHERSKHLLGQLIVALAYELGMDIAGFGNMTFKRRRKKRGLEPDECYWIQNEGIMRGKQEYDPRNDPPPDLVLEVEVSRSALNRLEIYLALGVPEVWRWDGTTITVHLLDQNGTYVVSDHSRAFPSFRPVELVPFLGMAPTQGERKMVQAFRDWVRDQAARGWPSSTATP